MKEVIIGIVCALALVFGIYYMNVYFLPKYEQLRHDVIKNSQAWNDGIIRNVRSYQVQWVTATPEQKIVIKTAVLAEVNGLKDEYVPSDVRVFVNELRSGL